MIHGAPSYTTYPVTKMLCTFVNLDDINTVSVMIKNSYTVLYNKIFVLKTEPRDTFILTYNIDAVNISDTGLIPKTIIINRNKVTNTLYTINAVKKLMNQQPVIDWNLYKNRLLVLENDRMIEYPTSIHTIIHI